MSSSFVHLPQRCVAAASRSVPPHTETPSAAKRFREFVGLANFLDGTPKDEVLDVLGFLACEVVRSLCERGLAVKSAYEASKALAEAAAAAAAAPVDEDGAPTGKTRQRAASDSSPERTSQTSDSGAKRRKRDGANTGPTNTPGTTLLSLDDVDESDEDDDGSAAFMRPPPAGLFTAPISRPTGSSAAPSAAASPKPHDAGEPPTANGQAAAEDEGHKDERGKKDVKPAKMPLTVMDVEDAYAGMQTGRARMKMSGVRNFGGGLVRIKGVV